MLALLEKINDGVGAVTKVVEPNSPVAEGEEVIGEINDLELKKLFTFRYTLIDSQKMDSDSLKKEAEYLGPTHKHDDDCSICFRLQALKLKEELIRVVSEIFWHSVYLSLDIKNLKKALSSSTGDVGVRVGWKIVLKPKKESNIRIIGIGRFPF